MMDTAYNIGTRYDVSIFDDIRRVELGLPASKKIPTELLEFETRKLMSDK